jgi:hypothetical protein
VTAFVARRITTMPVCRTMGHAGSIDFAGLVRMNAKSGYFVDPDFPADDTSIWTEGSRSGFGVIASLPSNVSAWCLVLNPVGEVSADRDMEANNRGGGARAQVRGHGAGGVGGVGGVGGGSWISRLALPPRGRGGWLTCDVMALRCADPLDAAGGVPWSNAC